MHQSTISLSSPSLYDVKNSHGGMHLFGQGKEVCAGYKSVCCPKLSSLQRGSVGYCARITEVGSFALFTQLLALTSAVVHCSLVTYFFVCLTGSFNRPLLAVTNEPLINERQ